MENLASLHFYTDKALFLIHSLEKDDLSKEERLKKASLLKNRICSMDKCVDQLINKLEKGDSNELL